MRPNKFSPQAFNNFHGYPVKDIKEWRTEQRIEIILERVKDKDQFSMPST